MGKYLFSQVGLWLMCVAAVTGRLNQYPRPNWLWLTFPFFVWVAIYASRNMRRPQTVIRSIDTGEG